MKFRFEHSPPTVLVRVERATGACVLQRRIGARGDAVYGLRACRAALRPGGVLAIWSSEPAPACLRRLAARFDAVREWVVPVQRAHGRIDYRILTARRVG